MTHFLGWKMASHKIRWNAFDKDFIRSLNLESVVLRDVFDVCLFCRYEVRVEACTLLGCAASDWSSVQTLESPPTGQPAPLLELQTNTKGVQTVFLVSWSPPAEPNGKLLHYELYRKRITDTASRSTASLVYRNSSTSCHDDKLLPYTAYEYQVMQLFWLLNSFANVNKKIVYWV